MQRWQKSQTTMGAHNLRLDCQAEQAHALQAHGLSFPKQKRLLQLHTSKRLRPRCSHFQWGRKFAFTIFKTTPALAQILFRFQINHRSCLHSIGQNRLRGTEGRCQALKPDIYRRMNIIMIGAIQDCTLYCFDRTFNVMTAERFGLRTCITAYTLRKK